MKFRRTEAHEGVCDTCASPAVLCFTIFVEDYAWKVLRCSDHTQELAYDEEPGRCIRCFHPTSGSLCRLCVAEVTGEKLYIPDNEAFAECAAVMYTSHKYRIGRLPRQRCR